MTEPAEVLLSPAEAALPAGLRGDWPVPRIAVWGDRGGPLAAVECALVVGAAGLVTRLPRGLQEGAVGLLARLGRRLDRRHSDAARAFLRQALGGERPRAQIEALVLASWRHLLRTTLDSEAFERHVPAGPALVERYEVAWDPEVRRAVEERRGILLVTGHFGDWEAGSAVMPWIGFDPFYAVARPPRNRPLSQRLQRQREGRGIRVLPRRGAMQHARAVVEAGGTIAMLVDQRARGRHVLAPFFGRPARCDRGAAVLLKRLGAPVVFAACYRTERPWRWRVELGPAWRPEDLAGLGIEAITARVNRELERRILAAPDQYFWLHDRYRGAPGPGEGAPTDAVEERAALDP